MNASQMARMIALSLDHRRGDPKIPELLELEAALEDAELQREKGKNPVAFLLKRIDLSDAPFPIFLDIMSPIDFADLAKVRLMWLPDGDRDYVEEYERSPVPEAFDPSRLCYTTTTKVNRRPARRLAANFEIGQREAFFDRSDFVAQFVTSIVQRHTGYRPRVKTERELFREMRPEFRPGPAAAGGGEAT